ASRMLGFYIESILDYLYVRLAEEMLITVPFVTENVPILSVMLRTYYKILLVAVGFLAAYSLIKLRSKRNVRFMLWVLLAGSISFGATFFTASLGNSMVRGLIFLAIPLAFLSLSVIVGRSKKTMQSRKLSFLTLLVSLIIIPQFLLVHETSLRVLNLPSVDAACMFVANTKNGQPIAAYGGFPVYYCFYDPKFRDYNMIGYPVEPSAPLVRNLSDIADFLIQSDGIKFIAFRNIQVWGYNLSSFDEAYTMWTIEVFLPLERELGKVYDNGFERIYR
ncbi:hypothetical protein GTO27_00020, partial [Candidatus Bathyarchaeota archaeon]|nr:hypothetical protein [Candidatus Bathyarchaeota archaeon]